MIRHIDLSQNATENAVARPLHRPVEGVRKWYAVEASAVPELLGVNPKHGLMESEVITRRLPDFSKYAKPTIAPSTVTRTSESASMLSAMAEFRTAAVVRNPITILKNNMRNRTVTRRDPRLSILFAP